MVSHDGSSLYGYKVLWVSIGHINNHAFTLGRCMTNKCKQLNISVIYLTLDMLYEGEFDCPLKQRVNKELRSGQTSVSLTALTSTHLSFSSE